MSEPCDVLPNPQCKLVIQEMLAALQKETSRSIHDAIVSAMQPFVEKLNADHALLHGNGKPGILDIVQELKRERDAEKRFRDRLFGVVWGNIAALLTFVVLAVIAVWLGWVHIHDGNLHTRIIMRGERPLTLKELNAEGKIVGQAWLWQDSGDGSAAHGAAVP